MEKDLSSSSQIRSHRGKQISVKAPMLTDAGKPDQEIKCVIQFDFSTSVHISFA